MTEPTDQGKIDRVHVFDQALTAKTVGHIYSLESRLESALKRIKALREALIVAKGCLLRIPTDTINGECGYDKVVEALEADTASEEGE